MSVANLAGRETLYKQSDEAKDRGEKPANYLWASKIGDRVVGLLHLVGVDRQAVSITLFRVDPEYRHTTVPTNLIQYVHAFCCDRGCTTLLMESHVAPAAVLRQIAIHGFRLVRRKLMFGQDVLEFRVVTDEISPSRAVAKKHHPALQPLPTNEKTMAPIDHSHVAPHLALSH
jgi:hypothetical protein